MTGIKNLTSRQVMKGYASLLLSGHFKALTVPPLKKSPQPLVELKSGQIRDSLRIPLLNVIILYLFQFSNTTEDIVLYDVKS